jgi:hypothetical protein
MRVFSSSLAYLAASIILCNFPLSGAVEWDRPKADPFAQSPDVIYTDNSFNETYPDLESNGISARGARDFYLRLMPLGASITYGQASSDGNGYRKALRQQLRWKGWKVNMVGSSQAGNMNDNASTVPCSRCTRC